MKNIHVLPTDLPSRLYLHSNNELQLRTNIIRTSEDYLGINQHIYITNSEKPKARDWVLGDFPDNSIGKVISKYGQEFTAQSLNGDKYGLAEYDSNKIILTTDPDLIKEGIQSIDDEFLKWFVENPSCEFVQTLWTIPAYKIEKKYRIEIPQEEPKQLTVEEVAEKYCLINNIPIDQMIVKNDRSCEFETPITMFIKGAKSDAAKEIWYKKFWEDYESKFKNQNNEQ